MYNLCLLSRSPSPEPEYGRDGKRVNTREVRYKKKMEDERHKLILDNQSLNPEYKAPMDYRYTNLNFSLNEAKINTSNCNVNSRYIKTWI